MDTWTNHNETVTLTIVGNGYPTNNHRSISNWFTDAFCLITDFLFFSIIFSLSSHTKTILSQCFAMEIVFHFYDNNNAMSRFRHHFKF